MTALLTENMRSEQLRERMAELGWKPYRLAQEVAKLRQEMLGEEIKNPRTLVSSINKALLNPNKSQLQTIELIVAALYGSLWLEWSQLEPRMEVVGKKVEPVEIERPAKEE